MHIEIKRNRTTHYGTDGRLYIDGNYVCDTTENPVHHLPTGSYKVTLQHNAAKGRKVPVLTPIETLKPSVVRQSSPADLKPSALQAFLAYGNGLHNIRDCRIHVGEFRVSGLVIHSYDTFKTLYDRINNSQRRGNDVTLTITE